MASSSELEKLGLFELIRKSRHAKSILMALNRKIAYLREDEIASA